MFPSLDALIELVREAGELALDDRAAREITEKGEFDFATRVDFEIQRKIRTALANWYPNDQFMGEEGSAQDLDLNCNTWILDPIDGTTNLIHRYPECAVSLAYMVKREIVLGIIYNPFRRQLFHAQKGGGAFMNGRPIHVSEVTALHESLVSIGTSPYTKEYAKDDFEIVREMFENCHDIRRGGAAALDMVYVACGITEAFYERKLKAWDYSAAMRIVEEAGGRVTRFDGTPVPIGEHSPCLSTNGFVHAEMLSYTGRMKL